MTYNALIIISIILGIIMLIMAFYAIYAKKLSIAIISTGVLSLFAAVLFLVMAAPDVAMTEAAIGSGLTTVIFFYVLNKITKKQKHEKE